MSKTIFIIGGIGSGKSTLTHYFAQQGVPTLDLDQVGHEVLKSDAAKNALVKEFGEDILDADGSIVRSALAAKAFVSSAATKRLTAITAPLIVESMKEWAQGFSPQKHPFVIVEVSAYDGPQGAYGHLATDLIAVTAPVDVRIMRASKNGFNKQDLLRRIERQASDEQRRSWARYLIENDGDQAELKRKLDILWEELQNAYAS